MCDIDKIIKKLKKLYGVSKPPAVKKNSNIFKLLIRTILSANNTDENAIAASDKLFSKYKTPKQISKAPLSELKVLIKRGVFFNVKSKNIKKLSKILLKKYKGKVPNNMKELVELPGVGRKTANIVLSYGFKKTEGIAVDTHVFRTVNRIGVVNEKTRDKTEKSLLEKIPKKYWLEFNRLFVMHGREICNARKPKCKICPIKNKCNYFKTIFS